MSISAAGRKHGILRVILSDRVTGRHTAKHGRPTELNKAEEQSVVDYIKYMAVIAHPFSALQLKLLHGKYLNGITIKADSIQQKVLATDGGVVFMAFIKRRLP